MKKIIKKMLQLHPMWLVFAGAVISAYGGIRLAVRNKKNTETIISLNKEIATKSDQLSKFLGSSDAYPLLTIASSSSGFSFKIENEFEYPLYDVVIVVHDFSYILKNSTFKDGSFYMSRENFDKSVVTRLDENQIPPHGNILARQMYKLPQALYYIKLKCRSQVLFEKFGLVPIGNKIAQGFMVYSETGKIIKTWYGKDESPEVERKLQEMFDQIPTNVTIQFKE